MNKTFALKIHADGYATLGFDLPHDPLQKLTARNTRELRHILDGLRNISTIKAMIVKRIHIPQQSPEALDTSELQENPWSPIELSHRGQAALNKLADLPFPSVAVIDGPCRAEDLELALACSYRIASRSDQTRMSLPYVHYGVTPPFGGSQRLPRLVGFEPAAEMIVHGREIGIEQALRWGLVDATFDPEMQEQGIGNFLEIIADPEPCQRILGRRKKLHSWIESFLPGRQLAVYKHRRRILSEQQGDCFASLCALDLLHRTARTKRSRGLELEAEEFGHLAHSLTACRLMNLQEIKHRVRSSNGQPGYYPERECRKIAILGDAPNGHALAELCKAVVPKLKHLVEANPPKAWPAAAGADILVDAAVEDIQIKQEFLKFLDQSAAPPALILTMTGVLPLTKLTLPMNHPERVVGFHLVPTTGTDPLVEIVQGAQTRPEYVVQAVRLAKQLGLLPIVVMDQAGFLVARLTMIYLAEALDMLARGACPWDLDKAVKMQGAALGPCELLDQLTLGEAWYAGNVLKSYHGNRFLWNELMSFLCDDKGYGWRPGEGIYQTIKDKKQLHPTFMRHLQSYRHLTGYRARPFLPDEVRQSLHLAVVNEAFHCLEDGVIGSSDQLDLAAVVGMGFPAPLGGPLTYAEEQGMETILQEMTQLERGRNHRFRPCRMLTNLVHNAEIHVPAQVDVLPYLNAELPSVIEHLGVSRKLIKSPIDLHVAL